MTLGADIVSTTQRYLTPPNVMFFEWVKNKLDLLFAHTEIKDALINKIYILGKRLGYSRESVLKMEAEERDALYNAELELIEHERKQNEQNDF